MSHQLPEPITEHPLFKAVKRCINISLNDHYDYRAFYPSWLAADSKRLTYQKMIEEVFEISEEDVKTFIDRNRPLRLSLKFYDDLASFDTEFCKDIMHFVFSLPILEYELHENLWHFRPRSKREKELDINVRKFKYNGKLTKEIEDNEIWEGFKDIVNSSKNTDIIEGLSGIAFIPYYEASNNTLAEPNYAFTYLTYVVNPLCHFMKATMRKDVYPILLDDFTNNQGSDGKLSPDIILSIKSNNSPEWKTCCTILVKRFPIAPLGYELSEGSRFFTMDIIPSYMKEKIIHMIHYKTNYGVLSDTYISIILTIDLDVFEAKKEVLYAREHRRLIPLRYKVINNYSHFPSARMALLYHFSRSVVDLDDRERKMVEFQEYMKKDHLYYLQRSTENSFSNWPDNECELSISSIERNLQKNVVWEKPDSVIQNGIYNCQVFKLDAKHFEKFFLVEVVENMKIIAKVYDPIMCQEANEKYLTRRDWRWAQDAYKKTFAVEHLFIQELYEDKDFNSCYIPHRSGSITIMINERIATKGYFTLFHFIECKPLPRDIETYIKAKKQLEVIHSHGIIHGDIAKRNILYSQDDKVYIIDFQNSIREKSSGNLNISKEVDMNNLNTIFLR